MRHVGGSHAVLAAEPAAHESLLVVGLSYRGRSASVSVAACDALATLFDAARACYELPHEAYHGKARGTWRERGVESTPGHCGPSPRHLSPSLLSRPLGSPAVSERTWSDTFRKPPGIPTPPPERVLAGLNLSRTTSKCLGSSCV